MLRNFVQKITESFRVPAPPPQEDRIISQDLIKKIRDIQVKTHHLVNHMLAGEYVSAFKGRGMEFREVREYQPGDDIRLIEWNVTARMGHPYIKEFREEREMTVMLLVDVSSSGEFGSHEKLKNEVAAEVASILAYSAIKNNDKVGLIVFSDKIEHVITPQKGRAHIWNVIRTILNFKPEGRRTRLALPIEYLLRIMKRKAVVFLISDFQADDFWEPLRLARQKHDLVSINIVDPRERELPDAGLIHLEDAETGETMFIDSSDPQLRLEYEQQAKKNFFKMKRRMLSIGIDIIEIRTDGSPVTPIAQYFKMREKRH